MVEWSAYSQYGGESRSFALTHAQGGERSRHCWPLITPAKQGDGSWHDREKKLKNFFPPLFSLLHFPSSSSTFTCSFSRSFNITYHDEAKRGRNKYERSFVMSKLRSFDYLSLKRIFPILRTISNETIVFGMHYDFSFRSCVKHLIKILGTCFVGQTVKIQKKF